MADTLDRIGEVHETDVFIVGGGLAGNNAALGALEAGARVLVADKASLDRCGDIAGGIDHFMAYLGTGPLDTREAYLEWAGRIARGAINLSVQNAVFCRELDAALERMERIGCTLKQPDGTYYRTQSLGQPFPYFINFNGKHLKPVLAREARRLGVKTLEKCSITGLLTADDRVTGAVGFNIRTGRFYVVRARAVIVATGNTNRIFENASGIAFNTWQCPANTGAAQMMGFNAGADLANMEIMRITVVPRGFSAAGLNALTGMGGKIVNAAGEEFMTRYHPAGSRAPRYKLAEGVYRETMEGRGPVYVDCTHLSPAELAHLKRTLGYDKDTLPDFIEQKGIDLGKQPLELMASEGMQAGPSELCGSGVMIDEEARSTIPGLFAAGDCTDQMRCMHVCTTGGYYAGKMAGRYAAGAKAGKVSVAQVKAIKQRVYAPLNASGEMSRATFEGAIRKMMGLNAGVSRTERSLENALEKLDALEKYYGTVKAENYHELMRVLESREILEVARIMCHASLARKETRFGIFHNRVDYPETRPELDGQIVVRKVGNEIHTLFRKLDYETIPER